MIKFILKCIILSLVHEDEGSQQYGIEAYKYDDEAR